MIIDDLEFADVAFLLHDGKKARDDLSLWSLDKKTNRGNTDLAARSNQYLALTALLRIADALQRVGEHVHASHDGDELHKRRYERRDDKKATHLAGAEWIITNRQMLLSFPSVSPVGRY